MLVLASTSVYRRELLARLRLPFDTARPDLDETPLAGEAPDAMVRRLSLGKARAVARQRPGDWVIGSDQAAELDGRPLGKPGDRANAVGQLMSMSGRDVRFLTGISLLCRHGDGETLHEAMDITTVRFRPLQRDEVERYVDAETPYDCAGSFKCEGLGIALFDAIETCDPTALVGLPLIATARLLRAAGHALP
ncbi:Maf family protein [Marilutibacter spongiae]|uniref:7-methyl-GTP pyrophosphatase n=1 Tax=Marilutibacter spongiae TaxID=2025720 RepID=A0A7W3TMK4_9GAMM|nr:Maf family nucleotide pyrophosphatase [Lysobacter spongiae]MBB1061115.1 septum formation inhibitor Maf [Lysobacter spongiae]